MEYPAVRNKIKGAIEQITISDVWNQQPVVVVDYRAWSVQLFADERSASDYLERYCDVSEWSGDELPFNAEDDEEIVVIKYCGDYMKEKEPRKYKDYTFYKRVNELNIYRKKVLANFEATVEISVHI